MLRSVGFVSRMDWGPPGARQAWPRAFTLARLGGSLQTGETAALPRPSCFPPVGVGGAGAGGSNSPSKPPLLWQMDGGELKRR